MSLITWRQAKQSVQRREFGLEGLTWIAPFLAGTSDFQTLTGRGGGLSG